MLQAIHTPQTDSPADSPNSILRPTRTDIARLAGVSLATVTHALSPIRQHRIREATRRRIHAAADRLGYRSRLQKRGNPARPRKTCRVGVLFRSIATHVGGYMLIVRGLMEREDVGAVQPVLLFMDRPDDIWREVDAGELAGIVAIRADSPGQDPLLDGLNARGVPMVFVNFSYAPAPGNSVGEVKADNAGLMREIVASMRDKGCRTFLEVTPQQADNPSDTNQELHHAFIQEMAALSEHGVAGLTLNPATHGLTGQLRNLLAAGQRWDGVYVDGTQNAPLVARTMEEHGLLAGADYQLSISVTTDIRLGGRGELLFCYMQDWVGMGRAARDILEELRSNGPGRKTTVPYLAGPGAALYEPTQRWDDIAKLYRPIAAR